MKIESKLPNVGTSIFATMSQMARDYSAINLSQGFPDFNCNKELIDLVHKYQIEGQNQYAPMPGIPKLREIISQKIFKLYGERYNPDTEITITAGATQALFTAILASVGVGDEVIVFEPAYDSYIPAIIMAGGVPIPIELKGDDFYFDWDEVKQKISSRTIMIIINSPHNPSGSIITEQDIKILEEIISNRDILILSDEVYEHIIFDNHKHCSVALYKNLISKSILVFSFGKTYHTTGWKMGYVLAPENLTKEFRKVHQFNAFSVNTPIQYAYSDYMNIEEKYHSLGKFYEAKRDYFNNQLFNSDFKIVPSKGTYFQLLDYSEFSDLHDFDFAMKLVKEFGIAVIPLSPFYTNKNERKLIRICFAKSEEVLYNSAQKLLTLVKKVYDGFNL